MERPGVVDASVDPRRIASSAVLAGQSYVAGSKTRIGAGAVIRNSYLQNAVVEDGATVVDSVLVTEGEVVRRKPGAGFGAKWTISADETRVGANSAVEHSLAQNTSIGANTTCRRSALFNSTVGESNHFADLYARGILSKENVVIQGPTEVAGSWLGSGLRLDECAFLNGLFSNDFYVYEFNAATGAIEVKETVEIPHVSRYGRNMIDSGNSGNLRDQEGGALRSLGPHVGTWHNPFGRGGAIKHSPLCLVSGWTKVVGKVGPGSASAAELIQNTISTYLMPFSVSGLHSDQVLGQVITGEQNNAYSYKHRVPGWTFSHAPGTVFAMIRRLCEAGADPDLADRIVKLALRNALALLRLYAHQRKIDFDALAGPRSGKGWKGWLARAKEIYEFHLHSGLWEFKDGEPTAWRLQNGKWRPDREADLLRLAPDALENQTSEEQILRCPEQELEKQLGVHAQELEPTLKGTYVDPAARVSPKAWIGPGVRILGESVVGDGVRLYRSVVRDSTVREGASLLNSVVADSTIGNTVRGRCLWARSASIGRDSIVDAARIERSEIDSNSTLFPYAEVTDSHIKDRCIIGSTVRGADVDSLLMAYHMAGTVEHLHVEPVTVVGNGETRQVRIIPMLGGGVRVLGKPGNVVSVSCSFIGSNTVLEAGAYVGFGCFVVGRLSGGEGLPPFTVSTGPGPGRDQIGSVASNFPHIIISHFIQWSYQANGPEHADTVARMVPGMLAEGREAVRAEITRRQAGAPPRDAAPFAKYRSLKQYTLPQLEAGLRTYDNELSDDRWQMTYVGGELRFTGSGRWGIANGIARWHRD